MAVTLVSNTVLNNIPNQDVTASATATAATATATLPAVASKTNVLTGFDVTFNAAPTTAGTVTVTGIGSGTLTYNIPAATTSTSPLVVQLTAPMICSTGTNQAISVACTTLGAAVTSFVNVYGFLI